MEIFDNIAISSRIRLARNVRGSRFGAKASDEKAEEVLQNVREVLEKLNLFNFLRLKDLPLRECSALFEQHLISRELIENKDISAVAISEDEKLIVMINEEDHIREQCLADGFNLLKPLRTLKKVDEPLLEKLDIAFDERLGFITASPSNLGSGMRASVMLFLPALVRLGKMGQIISKAASSSLTVRGIYGEGSEALGDFYQISNQGMNALAEEEIIDRVSEFIYEVCAQEAAARENFSPDELAKIRDEGARAYGILTCAFSLEEKEMMRLLSRVMFAESLYFMEIKDKAAFQKLYYEGASASIKELFGFFDKKKENELRAEYISKKVKSLVKCR